MGRRGRALLAVLGLAWVRARARPGRWLPAAAGAAVGVALLGAVAGLGLLAADRAARTVLDAVPAERRAVTLSWTGAAPPAVDARARAALGRMTAAPGRAVEEGADGARGGAPAEPQTRTVLRQPAQLAGRRVRLAAIRPLERWVRVAAGRLPRTCTAARCEVLQLGGAPVPGELADRGVRLAVVGRAELISPVPLGFVPAPPRAGDPGGARAVPPLLAAGDPGALEALPGLRSIARVQGWSAPLDLPALRAWDLAAAEERIRAAAAAAALRDRGLTATAPLDALRAARARAAPVRERLLLAAAPVAAAVAAFLLLAAGALRRGLRAELDRLERRGATQGQRAGLAVAECAVPAVAGTAAGAVAAVAVVAAAGPAGDVGAGAALGRGLAEPEVVLGALAVVAGALALALAAACAPSATGRRLADLALVAAGAAAGALALREPVRTGADGAAALLPLLLAVTAGLATGRLAPAALRRAGRWAPAPVGGTGLRQAASRDRARGSGALRLALLDLARRPGPAALAAGGLTVAVGLGAFAFVARGTLAQGARDQAAFAVPLDASVTPGPRLEGPLARRDLQAWSSLPGVAQVAPILRRDADAVQGPSFQPVTLLGAPAEVLRALGGPTGADASHLRPARGPAPPAPVPLGVRELRVRARAAGDAVRLAVALRRADGVTRTVPLGTAGRRERVLTAVLPAALRGSTVAGLEAGRLTGASATEAHQAAEDGAPAATARTTLVLGPVRDERGRTVSAYPGWGGHGAASAVRRSGAGALTAHLSFDRDGTALLRPAAAIDAAPLPVLTDPATARDAARGGTLELAVRDARIPARVAGTAARPPTIRAGGFALADASALAAALDALRPGAGVPRELWVRGAPGTAPAALARTLAAGGGVRVHTRAAALEARRADPLSRSLGGVLAAAALVGLALALLGLGLGVRRLVRDGAAELADLEADGTPPSALRRVVALQGAAMAALGLAGGVALAAGLTALAPAVVRAAAGGGAPVPPLQAALPAAQAAGMAVLAVLAAAVLVAALARRSFREAWPGRPPAGDAG